jgi:hypothetical protein
MVSDLGIGTSLWTSVGINIYRNSQVTIGQTTIINSDLGIKQNNTAGAFRIDSLSKTTRRRVFEIYEGAGILRHFLDNYGLPTWNIYNGTSEGGSIAFSTPLGRIGIITASSDAFNISERGELTWNPTATASNQISSIWTSRNTPRITIGGDGSMVIGNANLGTTGFFTIKPTTATFSFVVNNSANTINHFRIQESNGAILLAEGVNFVLGTTTGTRIGTATNQRIGFWNATPIVQPTTAVASATRVVGAGATVTVTDTFDGYTLAQIVKALRNTGLLA